MKNVLIIYAIVQLFTSAYGLAVIESVESSIESKLKDKGYKRNKNSLYKFNNSFTDLLKVFIPFYYFVKSFKYINNKSIVESEVNNRIVSGDYINKEDIQEEVIEEVDLTPVVVKEEEPIVFEKYKARKNDVSLYDTYETPVEYITRQPKEDEELSLSPFISETNNEVKKTVVKEEVSKSDIAKAIADLTPEELEALRDKLKMLASMKRENLGLKLEKDVA